MAGIAQKIIANPDAYSIDMLTKGVQDGTVPAYIGIPLIQQKTQEQKQGQAMMGGAQQQPPIAQQVLAEAKQASGLEGLPTNLPAQGYAPGGIIAFADGGEAEDDEDDLAGMSEDEKQLFDMLRSRMASGDEYEEMAGLGALPAAQVAAHEVKHEVSSKVGNEPRRTVSEGIKEVARKGHHPYENKVIAEAERQGVDPRLALHVLYKETGNLKDPASARSSAGAQGVMQLMPATARELGVKDPMDAQQNIEGGVKYLAQLGRMFDDPKLVAAAYNAGPGNVRKYNGVPPFAETRNYVQGLAKGGEVEHFLTGGTPFSKYASPEIANQIDIIDQQITAADDEINQFKNMQPPVGSPEFMGWKQKLGESIARKNALEVGYKNLAEQTGAARPYTGNVMQQATGTGKPPEILKTPPAKPTPTLAPSNPTQKIDMVNPDEAAIAAEKAARYVPPAEPKAEEPATTNPMGDYIGDYASYLKGRREDLAKDKEQNKYLALLQAGLGIMGGTSRYAGANIGPGASQGVAAYLAGNKQQGAEENAIQQGMLGLTRADLYNKMHLEDIKRKALADKNMEAYHQAQIGINQLNAKTNAAKAQIIGTAKAQDFNLKAEKAWKESDDYNRVTKDLIAQKKNWDKDPALLKQFNDARLRYIKNNLSEIQGGGNVANVDELLKD